MARQSTRARLGQSGGNKPMADLLASGWQWEGLRAHWYGSHGNKAMAQECIGRQRHFQRELDYLAQEAQG